VRFAPYRNFNHLLLWLGSKWRGHEAGRQKRTLVLLLDVHFGISHGILSHSTSSYFYPFGRELPLLFVRKILLVKKTLHRHLYTLYSICAKPTSRFGLRSDTPLNTDYASLWSVSRRNFEDALSAQLYCRRLRMRLIGSPN
jgi:hypothetical protein